MFGRDWISITQKINHLRTPEGKPISRTSNLLAERLQSNLNIGPKRSSGSHAANKRVREARAKSPPNRVHRRVVMSDFGKNIYKASSLVAMLAALDGTIKGRCVNTYSK
jgi:Fungal protein kinase